MPHHLPPSSTASNLAVGALLASAIAAGFLLFPGCSRCCPDRAAAMPMPRPTVTATASATVVVAPAPAKADGGGQEGGGHAPAATLTGADAEAAKHVHNYFRVSKNLASGASPESEADFEALAKAGIKSIVSVDGAKPPADLARKHGIRYVHVPIGYDGIPPATALELAKTFVTLHKDGPIFVHCHHGKHRGPAACSIGRMMIDGVSAEETTAWMKQAGTDPKYSGLYATVREFNPPSEADLATIEATMPEAAPTPPMREAMVAIDHHWDALKIVKKAKWGATPEHPDIDPPHEATILAEAFREMGRQPAMADKPDDFKAWVKQSEDAAWALSKALAKGAVDAKAADAQFTAIADVCAACHKAHRDHALGK
ncbi:MAG: cytochrome c [Planctomycetia bacterium]|nr:cytochrome c [Planctomycetia bacterium]